MQTIRQSLYLYSFNNYFNRYCKKFDTLAEYPNPLKVVQAVNWNPNDGVNTQHVINSDVPLSDYMIVVSAPSTIVSRWFVIETKRNCQNQYTLTLRRDLIADYYDEVISSPCYIEKATLQPNDPFIFNPEGNGFNQIKTSETLLKDQFKIPWIVGYYNVGGDSPTEVTANVNVSITDAQCAKIYTSMDSFHAEFPEQKYYNSLWRFSVVAKFNGAGGSGSYYETTVPITYQKKVGAVSVNPRSIPAEGRYKLVAKSGAYPTRETITPLFTDEVCQTLYNQVNAITHTTPYVALTLLKDQYIKVGSAYYKVRVNLGKENVNTALPTGGSAYLTLKNLFTPDFANWNDSNPQEPFTYQATIDTCTYTLEAAKNITSTITLNANKRALKDQPWRMFAIPYGDIYIYNNNDWFFNNKEYALSVATELAKTTSAVYDVQIVPYVINNGFWQDTSSSDVQGLPWLWTHSGATKGVDYDFLGDKDNPSSIIWYPEDSSFRNIVKLENPISITEPKIQNECDMYRLVGPNYSGAFEFNPAKNGGVYQFEINCTYLPAAPYIHVNPTFGGLYGSDFNDARGLICQGNFSISTVSDAWKNYVIQNKNYNEIFNREIENMEVNRSIQKKQEVASVVTGALAGIGVGAAAGAQLGGAGGIIGGVIGGITSGVGGALDLQYSQQLYDESKSFKEDMRNYSLGNIRALPQTLSKTSAYNVDSKYFPFLEYYTCTEKEKQALRDQIKYTGMTVMRTGTIEEFLQSDYSYVQGKMIRVEGVEDDYNLVRNIADEIRKGVYIK